MAFYINCTHRRRENHRNKLGHSRIFVFNTFFFLLGDQLVCLKKYPWGLWDWKNCWVKGLLVFGGDGMDSLHNVTLESVNLSLATHSGLRSSLFSVISSEKRDLKWKIPWNQLVKCRNFTIFLPLGRFYVKSNNFT